VEPVRNDADNHEIFAGLSDDELRKLVPEDLLAEYLKDGKPAEPGDPEDCIDPKTKKYVRPLIDYGVAFQQNDVDRSELVDLLQNEMRDKKSVEDALADAKVQEKFHRKSEAEGEAEKAKVYRQRDAVAGQLTEVQKSVADMEGKIQSTVSSVQAMVGQIAKIQWEATRRINQRTGALTQSGTAQ
jgi:hypothetical protein